MELRTAAMNKKPLISVILPAYNVARNIQNTLEDILSQSYKNIEILCVNDGSTDTTEEVIKAITDPRIRYFSKSNGGVSSARNMGLDNAEGEYISFVDPGDRVDKDFIFYLYGLLTSTHSDLAICSYDFETESGELLEREKYYEVVNENTLFSREQALSEIIKPYSKFCGHVWDKLFKRELIGALRFPENIHNCEDTLFDVAYIKRCNRIVLGPEIRYNYVQDSNSVTHRKYSEKFFTSLIAWEMILNDLSDSRDQETLKKRITNDVNTHAQLAWKTLSKEERKKFKDRLLTWMKKYQYFDGPKARAKRMVLKALWSV